MPEIAYAKINLSLRVVGRRQDGYHLLDSLVAFADIGDRIWAEPAEKLTLAVAGPFAAEVPLDDGNLVLQAAALLRQAGGVTCGATLTLEKNLPVASGIGGGSADAAATLRALISLWALSPDQLDLPELALSLGADVPVCLDSAACRMTGIGEELSAVPRLPDCGIVLVNPLQPCPTPAVFRARQGDFSRPAPSFRPGATINDLVSALRDEPNDLTLAAQSVCPAVTDVLAALQDAPSCHLSRMSGSGATCFGLFESVTDAKAAARLLPSQGWWIAAGRLLP